MKLFKTYRNLKSILHQSVINAKKLRIAVMILCAIFTISFASNNCDADVIIDNGQAGTSSTGSWYVSGGTTPYGDNSLWARNGATYTWQFNSQPAGTYEVFMWWTEYSSRTNAASVKINHYDGSQTVLVDQQSNGGQWNSLGRFYFNSTGSVTITAADGAAISTCADAVWFKLITADEPPTAIINSISPNPADAGQSVTFSGRGTDDGSIKAYRWESSIDGFLSDANSFSTLALSQGVHTIIFEVQDDSNLWSAEATATLTVGEPSNEIIIDNNDNQTSMTGTWSISGALNPYSADSLWARDGATFTWFFTPPQAGEYDVYMWWTEYSSRSTAADVQIEHFQDTNTVVINQQQNGGKWNLLGRYYFAPSIQGAVTIFAEDPAPVSYCADAVKFTFVQSNNPPTAQINTITPNPAATGQTVIFSGSGTDSDGNITAYNWQSNIDGDLSTQSSFSTNQLSEGQHTITFKVKDNKNVWSQPATRILIIDASANIIPTAQILSINPNPAIQNQIVTFSGKGSDEDGTIQGYSWQSNIDGNLSDQNSFSTNLLSAGQHTITFQVRDNVGAWSQAATQTLVVNQQVVELISDNGSVGTSYTGTWQVSSGYYPYGTNSLYGRSSATYIWRLTPTVSGNYEAFAWWTTAYSRSTAVPYDVNYAGGTTRKIVNQQLNGGKWNSLGTFTYTAGNTYTIKVTAQLDTITTTCADAVRLVLREASNLPPAAQIISIEPNSAVQGQTINFSGTGIDTDGTIAAYNWQSSIDGILSNQSSFSTNLLSAGQHQITLRVQDNQGVWSLPVTQTLTILEEINLIVDNGGPNTLSTGSWEVSGASEPYGVNSYWSRDGATYIWRLTPPISGNYEVFAWWTVWSSRSTSVPINIQYAGGSTTKTVNQQIDGGKWNTLGAFPFEGGKTYNITVTAQANPTSTCADAVRLYYKEPVNIPLPPTAQITSITPNPSLVGQTVAMVGLGTDSDGSIGAYNWRSSIDGYLGNTRTLSTTQLSKGTHTVYFKVLDDDDLWSEEVSATVSVGVEHIYISVAYGGNEIQVAPFAEVLDAIGATQQSDTEWTYVDDSINKTYYIHFKNSTAGLTEAMTTDGAHVIISAHSNYGLGPIFATSTEIANQYIENIRYIDDNRIINLSTPTVGLSVYGMRTGQAYPYWWPNYKDGTSGIAPYDFNDPNGDPPYNYYLTYQRPGDPNHYKVETVHNSAIQRFSDSGKVPWYSQTGELPNVNDPCDRLSFITNATPWKPSVLTSGVWQQFQDLPKLRDNSQYFKENYVTNTTGTGADYVRWLFDIPLAGRYNVSAWWPALSTNATNAPFTVRHKNGSTTVTKDQTVNGRQWNALGTFDFDVNSYSVLLTDNAAGGNVVADGIKISHVNNPPEVVQSDFIAMPMSGTAPLNVAFINMGTGDLTGREWDCGDGYTNTTRDFLTHEYIRSGIYTVSLTVTGPLGSSTKTKTAYIQVWDSNQNEPLKAEFAAYSKSGKVPLTAIFSNLSTGEEPNSWLWDFGDGQTSAQESPVHTYTVPGNYTVSLKVRSPSGTQITETKQNFVRAVVFEATMDNVDYPKTHYSGWMGKTMVKTKGMNIPRDQLKYTRMLYESCNSGDYFIQTLSRGLMFYTVATSSGQGSITYLQSYLQGKSNEQIWQDIQQVQAAYDYYNFNLPPGLSQQDDTPATLIDMSADSITSVPLTSEQTAAIEEMKSLSTSEVFEKLTRTEFMVNERLLETAIGSVFEGRQEQAVTDALSKILSTLEPADYNDAKNLQLAKKILRQFSNISAEKLTFAYEMNGDIAVLANLISAAGPLVGENQIRNMLMQALDDDTTIIDDNPEIVGRPLRICDLAYNQLVLNLKIKDVLHTIGTGMALETRDYHIDVLRNKL